MSIILPNGKVNRTQQERMDAASHKIFLAAKMIGEQEECNPLLMALLLTNAALNLINGCVPQDREASRTCYRDCLASMVAFSKAAQMEQPHIEVPKGETIN